MSTIALNSVRIPETNGALWLDALEDSGLPVELDVPWSLLRQPASEEERWRKSGLRLITVRDIIDPRTGRYLEDLHGKALTQVIDAAVAAVSRCREFGGRHVTLDLGMEHLDLHHANESLFANRLLLLNKVCPVAEEKGLVVCMPVRVPSDAPGADGSRMAANLIYEAGFKHFRVCLNVFPNDLPSGLDAKNLLRKTASLTAVICLFYSPCLGEELSENDLKDLVRAAKWHNFSGCVTLAPEGVPDSQIPKTCHQLAEVVDLLRTTNASLASEPDN
ncbi:MAG: hypothetical protein RRC34_06490 [Lentisphaeria bacterium]|nr:hypothetical protein [Lentisphaeria bacterium]